MTILTKWTRKFVVAFRGLGFALRSHASFWVHVPAAIGVFSLAAWLRVEPWRWAVLVIAVTLVLAVELVNTSIEELVKRLHPDHDPTVGRSLDIAAAAVLAVSIGALVVGAIALLPPLWDAVGN